MAQAELKHHRWERVRLPNGWFAPAVGADVAVMHWHRTISWTALRDMANDETASSLLLRVRDRQDQSGWREFTTLYVPVVRAYARSCGVAEHDVDDVVQEVLWAVSELIGEFDYDRARGRFRSWLWSVTHRRILKWRAAKRRMPILPEDSRFIENLSDSDAQLEACWEKRWRQHVVAQAMVKAQTHVTWRTFEAFRRYAILGQPAAEVAAALGMKVYNVHLCKWRVLDRIRREVELLDE